MCPELSTEERKRLHGETYAARTEAQRRSMRLDRLFDELELPDDAVVGDFGCGSALALEGLDSQRIGSYHGVDFSEPLLDYARERKQALGFTNAQLHHCSVAEFAASHAATLDVGLAFDFSEHVYDDEWRSILGDIRRALKPTGCLYLHTPNAAFFVEALKARDWILKQLPEHIAVRTAAHNERLLREAGFSEVETRFLPHYNVLRFLHPLSVLPMLGRWFEARLFIAAQP